MQNGIDNQATAKGLIGGQLGGTNAASGNYLGYTPWQQMPYPDYTLTGRVAQLEGEIRVLRELVIALATGREAKATP